MVSVERKTLLSVRLSVSLTSLYPYRPLYSAHTSVSPTRAFETRGSPPRSLGLRVRPPAAGAHLLLLMAAMTELKSMFPHGIICRFQLLVAPAPPSESNGWLLLSSTTALVAISLSPTSTLPSRSALPPGTWQWSRKPGDPRRVKVSVTSTGRITCVHARLGANIPYRDYTKMRCKCVCGVP